MSRGRRLGVSMLAVVLAGCGSDEAVETTDADGACPAGAVRLAHSVPAEEEGGDLFAVRTGGQVVRLTDDGGSFGPTVAPDGTRVAYSGVGAEGHVSDGAGVTGLDVYIVDADGSGRRRLVDGDEDTSPAWSPDGDLLAFVREASPDVPDRIFVADPDDGASARPLVVHDGPENDAAPAWAPDGEQIAFVRGGDDVVVAEADGTGARTVHHVDGRVGGPSWSPDGDRLAFSLGGVTETAGRVVVLDLATGAVTTVAEAVRAPWWSASGRLYGFARPPSITDASGDWRAAELELPAEGPALVGRAVGGTAPIGFLYGDAGVSTPACDADAGPLTGTDVPDRLTVIHPGTGEEVDVLTRAQAIARLDGQRDSDPDAERPAVDARLVYVDAADAVIEDRTGPQLVWVVGARVDPPAEDGALFDAVTGAFLGGAAGPTSRPWADHPDLAPP